MMRKIWAILLMIAGMAVSAFSVALMNDFIMLARPIILMGSKLRPNNTVVESAVAMALIMLIFMVGLALIVIAGVNIIKSFYKQGGRPS
ncbi:MAG: hypothetical protein NTY76_05760 [Candidatus Omnitrophica bacterium]|nr:hypothetical protein [Candidatus Omnitrophota bacterium]